MRPEIIVALDNFANSNDLMDMVNRLGDTVIYKIGKESFLRFGQPLVDMIVSKGHKVFLDLKLHDIPNTVAQAVDAIDDMGVWMTNVHLTGGPAMVEAASDRLAKNNSSMHLCGVTVLTSLSQAEMNTIYMNHPQKISDEVTNLVYLMKHTGLTSVVSSPHEVPMIKGINKALLSVNPGIRLEGSKKDDQKRTMTPLEAQEIGSDFLVIGRPITQSSSPIATVHKIKSELSGELCCG